MDMYGSQDNNQSILSSYRGKDDPLSQILAEEGAPGDYQEPEQARVIKKQIGIRASHCLDKSAFLKNLPNLLVQRQMEQSR